MKGSLLASFPEIVNESIREYLDEIEGSNSVSIHIRRGDYVTLRWAFGTERYRQMIQKFQEEVPGSWKLFVFSDDIEWCKFNERKLGFGWFERVIYVEGNTSGKNYLDLQLMSRCKAMILSNSAFAIWQHC